MKTKTILAAFILGVLATFPLSAATVTFSNLVTYAASGGVSTNYGSPVLIGTATVYLPPTINFQHGTLATTNAAVVYVQIGTRTASNLMTTVAVAAPATTNAARETIPASSISLPIYMQTAIVTTNNSSVGTTAVFVSP